MKSFGRCVNRKGLGCWKGIRAINDVGYTGPLSVAWEDSEMERERGIQEASEFVRRLDFGPNNVAFDAAFDKFASRNLA